ncbi:hypothetical protein [Vibrio hangzhouensis]|uniref:Uncharacterized protein n=1 Tax=Vibrio hangzhouensis TaxID=462991 RepID=A0A1H5S087_9VIBR|nr:hypothetical protein [Vibrio hangzhouensis]SEF44033.1 hypothetical protein SAMN04488244_101198 [Vibrio hangzhouensis]
MGSYVEQIERDRVNSSLSNSPQLNRTQKKAIQLIDNRVDQRKLDGGKASELKDTCVTQRAGSGTKNPEVIQRLSHEYYDRAELRYSSRAFAHMSNEQLEQYLWNYQSEIVVGQNRTILIGNGRRTGYAVNGNISYNCYYDERRSRHVIYVYHAHSSGRMG